MSTIAPTFTPTGTPQQHAWGDADCIGGVADPIDSLRTLRHDAGLAVFQLPGCPLLGATTLVDGIQRVWGDVNCSGDVNPVDGLLILRYDAGLSVSIPPGCVQIGQEVLVE